ncbi:type II toxin-antitoxin system VapC family toxin [Aquincola sp. S2]|uniref:Ribonuclease VapC n=1 Tax=Pseudaquabacterium terrae TaxID=2732868 RepID=A0ABX2EEB6_9BURK|nr:type II toxin-antitoxin system VapC family toxin [Aquabacterium terrae]NRF66941.1 type II toxin-antitoxin system VapC family toxin [Aquabacterium terrae]
MRPILIDTNAYTAFMLGVPEVVEVLAHAERLFVNSVVLGELLGGFAAGTREAKNRAELARFLDSPRVESIPITAQTADSYALIYAGLRRKGQPIPTNDLWIAASALELGAALLTRDAHFSHIDGLRCGQRLEDFLP